jgi:uncharacterized membrane protein
MNQRIPSSLITQVTKLFLLGSGVSLLFYLLGALESGNRGHWYLLWNLFLAWVPFGLGVCLYRLLGDKSWNSWQPISLTIIWLCFLPNTFYMITDFIHVPEGDTSDITYNVALFTSFITVSVALGFTSLAIVHSEMRRRLPARMCWELILGILFLVSFAIYVGRYLRWNTWDIVTNPAGILFDLSERFIHPASHPQTFATTILFFIMLSSGYYTVWRVSELLRSQQLDKAK